MAVVNMLAAKTTLSELVRKIESGEEKEIVIARDGKPAARLVALDDATRRPKRRLGLAEGKYATMTQEEFDAPNDAIWREFLAKPW